MGMRSNDRLHAQTYGDATQMDRALMMAQRRDDFLCQGTSAGDALDSSMVLPPPGGSAGAYGYWLQPNADGCSRLLFPGYWVAAY
jgi:hypothetical protein